jgi:hypothetical protein
MGSATVIAKPLVSGQCRPNRLWNSNQEGSVGIRNSSLTRVRPFFKKLIKRDPTGQSWLPAVLALAPNRYSFKFEELLTNPGPLETIDLDRECRLKPPAAFLRWLIEHPEQMSWPKKGKERFSLRIQDWREKLMGITNWVEENEEQIAEKRSRNRKAAKQKALTKLAKHGAAGSRRQWWAFEGWTSVDCLLPARNIRIYVEGKRTDVLAPSTNWYPSRNQLARNLESARDDAHGTPFACLVIAEQQLPANMDAVIASGLPHLAQPERQDLTRHFLGSITWRQAAEVTGIDYDDLPDIV